MRTLKLLVLSMALAWAGSAQAVSAPHDASFNGSCEGCHKLHASSGGTLIGSGYTSNNLACLGCHGTKIVPGGNLGFPWTADQQAVPGTGGVHHSWSGEATNPDRGAVAPSGTMSSYLEGTTIQCGTCHDPHPSNSSFASKPYVSMPTGVATGPTGGTGGTNPAMTLTAVPTTAAAKGYRIFVTYWNATPNPDQFRIVITNDAVATTPAYLKWVGGSWVTASGSTDATGDLMNIGTAYSLNDGTNVQVTFTGVLATGLNWRFYVAYPFLRVSNVADADGMCVQCHQSRVMDHSCVEGSTCTADGAKVFSHPVMEAMGAVGGTTVAKAALLDADGSLQEGATPDSNKTNDIVLDSSNRVGCLSCHAPHNADSNSLSVDAR